MTDSTTPKIDPTPFRDAGWQLIPLHRWNDRDEDGREVGKAPRDRDWTRRAYSHAEIDAAIASGANIGARPHAMQCVIDYDVRNDPSGIGLARLQELLGDAFVTMPRVKTGGGGLHLYGQLPEPTKLRNAIPELPGVEMKGVGRQVLVPGSTHPSGKPYSWDAEFRDPLCEAPYLPEALLEKYRREPEEVHRGELVAELQPFQLEIALAKLRPEDYRDHDDWLALGMAAWAAVAGDPDGMRVFVKWSTSDPKYADHAASIEGRWATWAPKPGEPAVTARSLFAQLPDTHGMYVHLIDAVPEPPPPHPVDDLDPGQDFDRIQKGPAAGKPSGSERNVRLALRKLGAKLSRDTFAGLNLVEGVEGCGPRLDDPTFDRVVVLMERELGFQGPEKKIERVMRDTCNAARFNPVRDYLDGCQAKWDGTERIQGWLHAYAGAEDTHYVRACGALQLIAAVRRVRQPGCKKDEALIFESPQGKKKSSALRILARREEWFTDSLNLGARAQEALEQLQGKWIVELAELKGLRRGDVERVKSFLSQQEDRARQAYDRFRTDQLRSCTFFGSTNDSRYLNDDTGGRRFWPVAIGEFDLVALERDVDQLWGEAAQREAEGTSLVLDPRLWADAAAQQERRRVADPWVEVLALALGEHDRGKVSPASLWEVLSMKPDRIGRVEGERLEAAMRQLGWIKSEHPLRFSGGRVRGFERGSAPVGLDLPELVATGAKLVDLDAQARAFDAGGGGTVARGTTSSER